MTRVADQGLRYNRFHVTAPALAHPRRPADRPQPPHRRVRVDRRVPGRFPGYGERAEGLALRSWGLQGNGILDRRVGKWHMTPDHVQGAAGCSTAASTAGFDHFWGFGGEGRASTTAITQDNTTLASRRARTPRRTTGRMTSPIEAVRWLHRVRAQDQEKAVVRYDSTGCSRATPGRARAEREVPRPVRPRLGRAPRGDLRTAEDAGRDPAGCGAHAEAGRVPAWDSLWTARRRCTRGDGGLCRLPGELDSNVGRLLDAVEELGELDNTLSSTSLGTTARAWRDADRIVQRADDAERDRPDSRGAARHCSSSRWARRRAPTRSRRTTRPRGRGRGRVPFQWGKQVASDLGGLAQRYGDLWPGLDRGRRGLRTEFTHCIDIGPYSSSKRPASRAYGRGRDRPEADGGDELPLHLRGRETPPSGTPSSTSRVLRATARSGQGTAAGVASLDRIPCTYRRRRLRIRPGTYDPEQDTWGRTRPARRLLAGELTSPRRSRRSWLNSGSCSGGGREAQRVAAAGRVSFLFGILPRC